MGKKARILLGVLAGLLIFTFVVLYLYTRCSLEIAYANVQIALSSFETTVYSLREAVHQAYLQARRLQIEGDSEGDYIEDHDRFISLSSWFLFGGGMFEPALEQGDQYARIIFAAEKFCTDLERVLKNSKAFSEFQELIVRIKEELKEGRRKRYAYMTYFFQLTLKNDSLLVRIFKFVLPKKYFGEFPEKLLNEKLWMYHPL